MEVENRLIDLLAAKMVKERRTITITEIAHACKMTRQNASRWMNNQVKCYPAKTIKALCVYFDCKPGDLIVLREGQAS